MTHPEATHPFAHVSQDNQLIGAHLLQWTRLVLLSVARGYRFREMLFQGTEKREVRELIWW